MITLPIKSIRAPSSNILFLPNGSAVNAVARGSKDSTNIVECCDCTDHDRAQISHLTKSGLGDYDT